MTDRKRPPVYQVARKGVTTWTINIDPDERALVIRLLTELRDLLSGEENPASEAILRRLFPPAFLDDQDKEAEYQRLMRDELVTSRVSQIDAVTAVLSPDGPDHLDESQATALMQSLNAVRVALGTMLDVGEDDDPASDEEESPELQLYGYLSWLLEWTVRSLSG